MPRKDDAMADGAQQTEKKSAGAPAVRAVPDEPARPLPKAPLVGVALSGGGLRAALFSLGVLIGLVDCRENRRVSHIASVSGGSITNASVAQSCEYDRCADIAEFAEIAHPLATILAKKGVFAFSWSGTAGFVKSIGPRIPGFLGQLFVFAFIVGNLSAVNQWSFFRTMHPRGWPWGWVIAIAAVVLLLALWMARGAFQEAAFSATLASMTGKRRRGLSELKDSSTLHVFVATDLISGEPVYFSRDFVACPAFGWGTPEGLPVASAVYASSAFPVAFPARRLRRKKFRFQGGEAAPPFPRLLKLTDGGVHNNLGTDWFKELQRQTEQQVWRFGNAKYPRAYPAAKEQIVVNAGAASSGLKKVWPFLSVRRTMSVLYDNTVQPRLELLRDSRAEESGSTIVLDITESPYHLAERYLHDSSLDAGQQVRADAALTTLKSRSESYWQRFARQTSANKTKLTRAGLESGARMVMHGYLSTIVAMHVIRNAPLPAEICDEGYFLDLCGRRPREPENADNDPAKEETAEPAEPTQAQVDVTEPVSLAEAEESRAGAGAP
jgi:predicted acylesterase/phospholipase RssA